MPRYCCILAPDDIATIYAGAGADSVAVGRALTKKDGDAIAVELNRAGTDAMREAVLSAVNDAIEEVFEGRN